MTWPHVASSVPSFLRRAWTFAERSPLRNAAILFGGSAAAQALTLLAYPVVTRVYSPHDFGILAAYFSIVSILTCVVSWRYEVAIPLPKEEPVAVNLFALCAVIISSMVIAVLALLLLAGDWVSRLVGSPEFVSYRFLIPAGLLAVGFYQALSIWTIRKHNFTKLMRTKFSQAVGQSLTQVGLGLAGAGPIGLMLGDIAGKAGGTLSLLRQFLKDAHAVLPGVTARTVRGAAVRYRRFPLVSSWAVLMNGIGFYAPALMLSRYYGVQVAGLFTLTQSVVLSPMNYLSIAVGQVYLADASEMRWRNPEKLAGLMIRFVWHLGIVVLPVLVLADLLASSLVPFVFGARWEETAVYLIILSPMFFVSTVGSPVFWTLEILERQDIHLLREALRVILVLGPLWLAGSYGMSPHHALMLYSGSYTLFYLVGVGLAWFALDAQRRKGWAKPVDTASGITVAAPLP